MFPIDFDSGTQPDRERVGRLLREMRAGSKHAGNELLLLLSPFWRRVIRRHLNQRVRRFEDSEDVLQNVLVEVARFLMRWEHSPDPYSFIATTMWICETQAGITNRHHLDVEKRGDASFQHLSELEEWYEPGSAASAPLEHAVAEETLRTLLLLPEPTSTIVDFARRGWCVAGIASALELDESTVRRHLRRAHALVALEKKGVQWRIPGQGFPQVPRQIAEKVLRRHPPDFYRILVLRLMGMDAEKIASWLRLDLFDVLEIAEKLSWEFPELGVACPPPRLP